MMSSDNRTSRGNFFMVGIAELSVVRDQELVLRTYPLGACLGIAVHDPVTKVSGLLHSMLPDSTIDPPRAAAKPGMFLDTGLAKLLDEAHRRGGSDERLLICVAGGGRIMDESAYFNLGQRNIEVLEGLLEARGLKIKAQSVGGLVNRTLQLDALTGEVSVKISGQGETKMPCRP
jgi:chemotaxis protein CheD